MKQSFAGMQMDTNGPKGGSPRKKPGPRGAYAKGDAKREEMIRGVIDLISREGYHRQSLRDLGEGMGVKPAHILYYFDNREELLQSVVELWDRDSIRILSTNSSDGIGPNLDLFVDAVGRNVATPGMGHLFLAFAAEAIDPVHAAHEFFKSRVAQVRNDLVSALRREQALGWVKLELNVELAARHLMALADGLQTQSFLTTSDDVVADLRAAVRFLRTGIGDAHESE